MNEDIRWIQRFDSYNRACARLLEIVDNNHPESLSELEAEGLIQRFEYTFELAWKLVKDYLQAQGLAFQPTPKGSLSEAFKIGIITDHDTWREMTMARNLTSHTYNEGEAEQIVAHIYDEYTPLLRSLLNHFKKRIKNADGSQPS